MITFKSARKFAMSDVPISVIETEISRAYDSDETKALTKAFHDIILDHSLSNVDGELAVYPCDIAAIFTLLKIPFKFIDVNGSELDISAIGSGIVAIA